MQGTGGEKRVSKACTEKQEVKMKNRRARRKQEAKMKNERVQENKETDRLFKEGYFCLFVILIIDLTMVNFRIIVYG